ncbi:MAG: hypothetical protein RIS09_749 [Actinomycetota bacterium]|jgi:RimJ/RimL family protein N-acetyltransferase
MNVRLRPYLLDEFEESLILRGISDSDQSEYWREVVRTSGSWVDHYLHLAIEKDGSLVGDLQLRRCHWVMPPGTVEIGIEIAEKSWGLGIGTQTHREVKETFINDECHRLSGSTDVENVAMIRAFEKANWTKEGILRGLFEVNGELRDYVSYSVIRGD